MQWVWQDEFINQFIPSGKWIVDGPRRCGKTWLLARLVKMFPHSVICTGTMRQKRELMDRFELDDTQVCVLIYERIRSTQLVLVDEYPWILRIIQNWWGCITNMLRYFLQYDNIVFIGTPDEDPLRIDGASYFQILPQEVNISDNVPKLVEMKRVAITDPVEARVAMINGWFDLPDETKQAMNEVRQAAEQFAKSLEAIYKRTKHDKGRAIATIDLIQQTKNVACDALILAHATKEEKDQKSITGIVID